MNELCYLQVRNSKLDETTIEATTQIFSSLMPSYIPMWKHAYKTPPIFSFEIYFLNQTIYFYVSCKEQTQTFVQSLLSSSYPTLKVKKTTDPMDIVLKSPHLMVGELVLAHHFALPFKTHLDFKEIDPISSIIGFMARRPVDERMVIQILITPASFPWVKKTMEDTKMTSVDPKTGTVKESSSPDKTLMMKKTAFQGGKAVIRLLVGTPTQAQSKPLLHNLAGTFGAFSLGEGNQFSLKKPLFTKDQLIKRMKERKTTVFERRYQILNAQELSTLWHPPGKKLAGIKNLAWGKTLAGEPPENLPVAKLMPEEERKDYNFFATTEFKNEEQIFGVSSSDRRKHMYIVGKTGAGKSTLIANMAIDDIRKGRGVGVIDPHGDLSEIILDYIPNRRLQDVVYLEPFDTERPFHLNVLEVKDNQHKDLVASGIVSIFHKLYAESWGPRLEYILRNVILSLLEIPDSTLADALPLLSQPNYRRKALENVHDQVITNFWYNEFDKMSDKLRTEAISPIQNKVGQFVSSSTIRNIIGHSKSTIDLKDIMDNKKILILNLSQGKLGEDNAALLGAMIINQIQLTAMNRAFYKEEDRIDFFLYVDEFQNFATSSFVKILSEARKYRLSLALANQYIEQLELPIQHAIFGNIGTLISFVVGARDATSLSKEFGGLYTDQDMVSMGKFETVLKLSINNMTTSPFPAKTLPLPSVQNNNREKITRMSKEKYGRKPVDFNYHAQRTGTTESDLSSEQKIEVVSELPKKEEPKKIENATVLPVQPQKTPQQPINSPKPAQNTPKKPFVPHNNQKLQERKPQNNSQPQHKSPAVPQKTPQNNNVNKNTSTN